MSIKEVNGASAGTPTTVTNVRFCTTDGYNPVTNYPMVKPAPAGTNYSYKKTIYLNADTSPSSIINNVKFYCDGTIGWTGVTVEVGVSDAYTQAAGTEGTTGDDEALNTNITTYTSASPLDMCGGSEHLDNPDTGKVGKYLELQAVVSDAAVAGALSAETVTFRYDEV
jgi:hypothetical protein